MNETGRSGTSWDETSAIIKFKIISTIINSCLNSILSLLFISIRSKHVYKRHLNRHFKRKHCIHCPSSSSSSSRINTKIHSLNGPVVIFIFWSIRHNKSINSGKICVSSFRWFLINWTLIERQTCGGRIKCTSLHLQALYQYLRRNVAIGRDHQTEIAYSFLFFSFVVHFGNANFALAHSIEIAAVVTIFDNILSNRLNQVLVTIKSPTKWP